MIQDKQLEFSNSQAITATAQSTNVIDLGARGSWGKGSYGERDVDIVFTVDQTFAAAGAATLTPQLRTSANSDMSGAVVVQSGPTLAIADLAAGADFAWKPDLGGAMARYCDINYVVATGPFTAGKLTARGTAARQRNV